MAKTVADILTSTAYRLGDDSYPTDASEQARWVRYINEALRNIVSRQPYWFTQASDAFSTVIDQEAYTTSDGFPADYRDMIELRVNNKVYTAIPLSKVFGLYDSTTQLFNYDDLVSNKHYYYFEDTLHILPAPSAVYTVNMKYFKYPSTVSATSDTFDIPDFYTDALVSYCFARVAHKKGRRGDAADGMAEFEEVTRQMTREHNRKEFYNKSARPIEPMYLVN